MGDVATHLVMILNAFDLTLFRIGDRLQVDSLSAWVLGEPRKLLRPMPSVEGRKEEMEKLAI